MDLIVKKRMYYGGKVYAPGDRMPVRSKHGKALVYLGKADVAPPVKVVKPPEPPKTVKPAKTRTYNRRDMTAGD